MTKLQATRKSVKKWENILLGKERDLGSKNCPLCEKYLYGDFSSSACSGCPVADVAGTYGCNNTPYVSWINHVDSEHNSRKVECSTCATLAYEELQFLRSLLPKREVVKKTNG